MMRITGTRNRQEYAEDGLTLIECLVAIVIIGFTAGAVGPLIAFSVATRVQNQRAEQALQLAQAEVDKVRLVVEQGGDYGDRLQEMNMFSSAEDEAVDIGAPTSFVDGSVTSATQARRVDTDGDGDADFAIQLFRTQGIEVAPQIPGIAADTPITFDMGVRVYDARAEATLLDSGTLETEAAGLTFVAGSGDTDTQPLAVLFSQVTQGDRSGSLCEYWRYTGEEPVDLQCN